MSVHGGNLREAAQTYGQREYVDFSANINPLGVPGALMHVFEDAVRTQLTAYPDPECVTLRAAIAEKEAVPMESILCGNGASEVLLSAVAASEARRVLIPVPCFAEYAMVARRAGAMVMEFVLQEKDGWALDTDALPLEGADLLIVGNPNNPTSACIPKDRLYALALKCRDKGVRLVVDEAFMSLTLEGITLADCLEELPNVVLIRAYTKSLAIAGVRLGYAVGESGFIGQMKQFQVPWSVNALAQAVAGALPLLDDYEARTREWLRETLPVYSQKMRMIEEIRTYSAAANFMLWRCDGVERDIFLKALAEQGVLIRSCANFSGLDGRYYRTAVRTRAENERLFDALKKVLG